MKNFINNISVPKNPIYQIILLTCISILAAILFYAPFILRAPSIKGIPFNKRDMNAVYGMWDGPLYVTAAASLWDPNPENIYYKWIDIKPSDLTERFPLYPLLIRLITLTSLGYWTSALLLNLVISTGATIFLYFFLIHYSKTPNNAFWICLISIFWPPRGFLYRYTLMSEPLFILGILGATYFYKRKSYYLCGLFGSIAVAARPNGFLVVLAFGILGIITSISLFQQNRFSKIWKLTGLLLMPLTLITIYAWHRYLFGDWLASYHASNFIHPQARLFPFLTFFHIGEEGTTYLFFLSLIGICELARRRHWDIFIICLVFYLSTLTVSTDVSRFLLPIFPFTFALAGDKILGSTPARFALFFSLPLIYIYTWSTMLDPGYQAPFYTLHALLP